MVCTEAALPLVGVAVTVTIYVPAFAVRIDGPLPLQPVSIVPIDSIKPIPKVVSMRIRLRRPKKAQSNVARLATPAGASHGAVDRFN